MPGLKFRVLLDSDKNEEVFRDIVIANDAHFETFYHAIMEAFNFKGDQMASFYVSNDSTIFFLYIYSFYFIIQSQKFTSQS